MLNVRSKKNIVVSVSLANLTFFFEWSTHLKKSNIYFTSAEANVPHLIALMLNVLLLTTLFLLGLMIARFINRTWSLTISRWTFFIVLLIPINGMRNFAKINIGGLLTDNIWLGYFVAATILLTIIFVLEHWFEKIFRGAYLLILILSPFVIVTFAQASWAIVNTDFPEKVLLPEANSTNEIPPVRVLWIIFDNMDQRIAFTNRTSSFLLPTFDKLRSQSLVTTKAHSPHNTTIFSIPALFTGTHVESAKVTDVDQLMIKFSDNTEVMSWSDRPNIFSETNAAGFETAIVGRSYHPYCAVFDYITTCAQNIPRENSRFMENRWDEVKLAMARQIYRLQPWWGILTEKQKVKFYTEGYRSIEILDRTLENTKDYITNPRYGLTFVHFNIPHDPYIYDRYTENYDILPNGLEGYIGNLVLADRALAELQTSMQDAGTWDNTAVIVTTDHYWKNAYKYDRTTNDREIPFLLKLPKQQEGVLYDKQFDTILTRDLISALLEGKVTNYSEAITWLDEHI